MAAVAGSRVMVPINTLKQKNYIFEVDLSNQLAMKKPLLSLYVTLLLLSPVLLIRCYKEYSYEGGPSAQYTIAGAPSQCTPVELGGNYYVQVPADSDNYLQVTVNTARAGSYNIFTIPVDGIAFSATGIFSDTGTQIVQLSCTGIPDSAGNFIIKIPGDNGCYFPIIVKEKPVSSYILTGNPGDCSDIVISGRYISDKKLDVTDTILLHINVVTAGTYTIKTDTINGISFSLSGYFADTGNQAVTLKSAGMPEEAGRYFFKVSADSSQCSFSIPVEPNDPLAVYVLEYGYDTICLNHTINGTYTSGIPLNNSNTLTFEIYATIPGNYAVYTTPDDGIFFGGSGFFEQGEQTITLKGFGTPQAAGTYKFTPAIIGPSPIGGNFCHFDLEVK